MLVNCITRGLTELKKSFLIEAVEEERQEADWAKYGSKVDDFINETIEKASKLHEEGEKLLFNEDFLKQSNRDEKYRHVSSRMGFLKNLQYKLAQKFEGLRREK